MIPECEFGDCTNLPVATMKFNDHGVGICSEHKIQVHEIVRALSIYVFDSSTITNFRPCL